MDVVARRPEERDAELLVVATPLRDVAHHRRPPREAVDLAPHEVAHPCVRDARGVRRITPGPASAPPPRPRTVSAPCITMPSSSSSSSATSSTSSSSIGSCDASSDASSSSSSSSSPSSASSASHFASIDASRGAFASARAACHWRRIAFDLPPYRSTSGIDPHAASLSFGIQ